jgi:enoyl-CoA hydratase/carnithine racemase
MNFSTISLKPQGNVLYVTIGNPPINLFSAKMVEELFQLAGWLQTQSDISVIVFDSADPDFFIAHFDLNDLMEAASTESANPDINGFQGLIATWQILPQVKIAKINGRCRGGGFEFILGLDMRFATTDSQFCFPEASGGFLAGGGGSTRTLMAAGPGRGLEVLLTSRDFSGEEAERYGLINRALPAAELDAYVEDLVTRVARRSPAVIGIHRDLMRAVFSAPVEAMFAGMAAENAGMRAVMAGEEVQNNITRLLAMGQAREAGFAGHDRRFQRISPELGPSGKRNYGNH